MSESSAMLFSLYKRAAWRAAAAAITRYVRSARRVLLLRVYGCCALVR